jgi:bifunctional non-homologous end joining protein LigD
MLGELLARVLVADFGEIATIARALDARDGKVYIDFLQNGHGKLLVAPFSARPVRGAQVSTPLRWSEATARSILAIHDQDVPSRMKKMKEDPIASVLGDSPDLPLALQTWPAA